jgi:hypothetical protein
MKRKPTFSPYIGSISEGTMRSEDLIPSFAYELHRLLQNCRVDRNTRKAHIALVNAAEAYDFDSEFAELGADDMVSALFEAMEHYAPPYTYFGAAQFDGADYGFWPCDIDDQVSAGYIVKIQDNDDGEIREHWGEDVYLINDHGNVECGRYDKRGRWHEYWSCV